MSFDARDHFMYKFPQKFFLLGCILHLAIPAAVCCQGPSGALASTKQEAELIAWGDDENTRGSRQVESEFRAHDGNRCEKRAARGHGRLRFAVDDLGPRAYLRGRVEQVYLQSDSQVSAFPPDNVILFQPPTLSE